MDNDFETEIKIDEQLDKAFMGEIMAELKLKPLGTNYSAWHKNHKTGEERYFCGEELFENDKGERIVKRFKIVCPKCHSEGQDLKHKNWGADEFGVTPEIICSKCGNSVSSDNYEDWKVYLSEEKYNPNMEFSV